MNNAAFYYVSSTDSGHPTLEAASKEAERRAAKYGESYTVFMALKRFEGRPKFYADETELSFGVEAKSDTAH